MKITFLGGVQGVTGSRYLIEHASTRILVDCGMFQGPHEIAQRNFESFGVNPKDIDAIVLTHAHIDHTGYIPALVKQGFKGTIYCSKGTYDLTALLLVDSGSVQEQEAQKKSYHVGGPDHPPTVALYTAAEAQASLKFFQPIDYDTVITIGSLQATLIRSGHILGSAFVIISDGKQKLTFSGDLGRPTQLIMKAPPVIKQTDFLVIESTYGDRLHDTKDTLQALGNIVNATIAKKGVLVIPCFAVGRTQEILYCLYQLQQTNIIAHIPIFLDSPLAIKVAELSCEYTQEYELSKKLCNDIFSIATFTRTGEESKKLDLMERPAIIIAGSGMADGGRVLFHLQRFISDAKNTILFVGYQAEGTKGNLLINGLKKIRIRGVMQPVRADIKILDTLSAHADYNEILQWLANFENKPKQVFVTHGEIHAAQSLKDKIEKRFGWSVVIIPKRLESFDLD